MGLTFKYGSFLEDGANNSYIITTDGAHQRMLGAAAQALRKRLGDRLWEAEVSRLFPIADGSATAATLPDPYNPDVPRYAILAAAFTHQPDADHARIYRRAMEAAFQQARALEIAFIDMPLSTGGWRLTREHAMDLLTAAYRPYHVIDVIAWTLPPRMRPNSRRGPPPA